MTQSAAVHLVFAYGTLRPGLENFREMAGARHIGRGKTVQRYALMADAELPYLARTPEVSHIAGDIFEVSQPHLDHLDAFEGHPQWYRRELIDAEMESPAKGPNTEPAPLQCWIYFCLTPLGNVISSGDYVQHLANTRLKAGE